MGALLLFNSENSKTPLEVGCAAAIVLVHGLIGVGLAINDRMFLRAHAGAVISFTILATFAVISLTHFAVRENMFITKRRAIDSLAALFSALAKS